MRRSTLWVMAIASAFAVANLYYNQPLLAAIAQSFHASVQQVGLIPTLTQAGYALGLLLFVPLGDRVDARRLIVITLMAATVALLVAAASPNLEWLLLASFAIGIVSVTAQLILPFAANLVSAARQGSVLGTILSAVFTGILLSQPLSGWLGAQLGWRSIYLLAVMAMIVLAIASALWLPQSQPSIITPYLQLMRSLWQLVKEQPILREASAIQNYVRSERSVQRSVSAKRYSFANAQRVALRLRGCRWRKHPFRVLARVAIRLRFREFYISLHS